MELVSTRDAPKFNLEEIAPRDFIRAKYHTWDEPRNGLVIKAGADELLVIFLPRIHLATRYYHIKAQEVADGKWLVLWSRDLWTVGKAGFGKEEKEDAGSGSAGEGEATEQPGSGEAGGICGIARDLLSGSAW